MSRTQQQTDEPGAAAGSRGEADATSFPYGGAWGQTRLEAVHLPLENGAVQTVQLHRVVNVASDPELQQRALSGQLHRVDGIGGLAVPFVYHDPAARLFALVVPEALRHQELTERARLLERLAADTEHPLPAYVRHFSVVFGVQELAARIEQGPSSGAPEAAAVDATGGDATARESQELVERERRMRQRAEDVTAREDELRRWAEELEARQRELDVREQELDDRFESLRQREEEAASRASSPPVLGEEEVEEVDDVEELQSPGTSPELELAGAVQLVEEGEEAPGQHVEQVGPDEVEELHEPALADADSTQQLDIEDAEDDPFADSDTKVRHVSSTGRRASGSSPGRAASRTGRRAASRAPRTDVPAPRRPSAPPPPPPGPQASPIPPPSEFVDDRYMQMAASLTDEGPTLFVRLDEGHEEAFEQERTDLLVQLSVVQGYPVVLLALADMGGDRPYVRRCALDPRRSEQNRLLQELRRDFAARLLLFGPDGGFRRHGQVAAPRGVNVAVIMQRVDKLRGEASIDAATALERALAVPPPVREGDHPFREAMEPAHDAAEALERVQRLEHWGSPETLDQALLALSVPSDLIDATFHAVIEDALRYGIALSDAMMARAVSGGLAAEAGELVARQLETFRRVGSADDGKLDPEQVADNWERLLQRAAEHELAIDGETHEQAWGAIRAARGDGQAESAVPEVDPAAVPDLESDKLLELLEHPKLRKDAALELCRRGDASVLEPLYKAVRKMPRDEVVEVVPRLLDFGEQAGDVLIDGLGARKTFVRQASAVALGELQLRRAIAPLLHLLQDERSEIWQEVGRVLGTLSTSAFRPVARALRDPRGAEERLAYTLAHLADNGCENQLEDLQQDPDAGVRQVAEHAVTLREVATEHARAVRGEQPPEPDDAIRDFSRRLYEQLGASGGPR